MKTRKGENGKLSLPQKTWFYLVLLPRNGTFYDSKYELTAHRTRNRAIVAECSTGFNSSSVSLCVRALSLESYSHGPSLQKASSASPLLCLVNARNIVPIGLEWLADTPSPQVQ